VPHQKKPCLDHYELQSSIHVHLQLLMLLNWQNKLKFNQIKPGDAVTGVSWVAKADPYELFIRVNYHTPDTQPYVNFPR
jgi:hypothetical protein